jgi:hypothetical protein
MRLPPIIDVARPMKVALTIVLLSASYGALADVWIEIGVNDKFTSYADPATIKKQGVKATMWTMYDYKAPQTADAGKKYMSMKLHYEFDCKDDRVRPLAAISFTEPKAKGDKVAESNQSLPSTRTEPDTVNGRLLQYACRR